MKLNVIQAPSVRSGVLDENSLTNEDTNGSKHFDDDKSCSEDEAPIKKQSINNTESTEDMFKRNIDKGHIQFGSSLAHVLHSSGNSS